MPNQSGHEAQITEAKSRPRGSDVLADAVKAKSGAQLKQAVGAFALEQHGLVVHDCPFSHHQLIFAYRDEPAMLVVPRPQATNTFAVNCTDLSILEADAELAWILFAEWWPNWTTGRHQLCLLGRTRHVAEMKRRSRSGGAGDRACFLVPRKWVEGLEALQDRSAPWDRP